MTRNEPGMPGSTEHGSAHQSSAHQSSAQEGGPHEGSAHEGSALRHMAEWLDGKLLPRIGPPHLGPYDAESEDSMRAHDACPLCAHPMREHVIDRSHPNAVLICPVPPIPEVQSFEPLNEVGMPKARPNTGLG